jgi:hypothetical protein
VRIFNSLGAIALAVFAAVLLSSVSNGADRRRDLEGVDMAHTQAWFNTLAPVVQADRK